MDIDELFEKLKPVFVTKEDLKIMKDEFISTFVTKEDLNDLRKEFYSTFATKKDLEKFATKEDLKKFATKDDLDLVANRIIDYIGDLHEKFTIEFKSDRNRLDEHDFRITKIENHLDI